MPKLIISADSTCDLSDEVIKKFDIKILPMIINFGLETFRDGVTITPDEMYERIDRNGVLPKTSAISIGEYIDYFTSIRESNDEIIIHFSISSGFSSTFQNSCYAAEEIGNVFPIDSKNLSTGIALSVIKACKLRDQGKSVEEITECINEYKTRVDASFIIDSLEYLHKGGRCSAVSLLVGTLFNIKPCIEVKNGSMGVGKKFRGRFEKVLKDYVHTRLDNASVETEEAFVTHAGCSDEVVNMIYDLVYSLGIFKKIYITRAGGTVSTHCGRNTLGVLFVRKNSN